MTHFGPVGQFEDQLPFDARLRACGSWLTSHPAFLLEGTRYEWTNIHG